MNTKSYSEAYKEAGVDITAGYKSVELMKQYVAKTMTKYVASGLGGFGGLCEIPEGYKLIRCWCPVQTVSVRS